MHEWVKPLSLDLKRLGLTVTVNGTVVFGGRLGMDLSGGDVRWDVMLPIAVRSGDRVSVLLYHEGAAVIQRSVVVPTDVPSYDHIPIEMSLDRQESDAQERLEIVGIIASNAVVSNWDVQDSQRMWEALIKIEELVHGV